MGGRAWPFTSELHVEVPNESKRHVLYLKGYGHDEQMDLACPGKEVAQPDSLEDFNSLPASEFDAGLEAAEAMGLAKFDRETNEPQTVFVGCCANDAPSKSVANPSALSGNGAFEIEWEYDDARFEG